jgi:GR25 family glycosyltransferase involved in LPS biosynthesis
MHINNYFDRIVVINLDRRIDRLRQFESQVNDLGIDFVRYSAIDAQVLGISPMNACRQSHHKVLTDAAADKVQRLLILEDDVKFRQNFSQDFARLSNVLPNDWQMLYLGSSSLSPVDIGIEGLWKSNAALTTHAYGIKAELFDTLIRASSDERYPIDLAYSDLHPKLQVYACWPSLVGQMASFSDIENQFVDYKFLII